MASSVSYKASVEKDLKKLDKPTAGRLLRKLEQALSDNPEAGDPLAGEFRGLFKYRVEEHRVVYSKVPEGVPILRTAHRLDTEVVRSPRKRLILSTLYASSMRSTCGRSR